MSNVKDSNVTESQEQETVDQPSFTKEQLNAINSVVSSQTKRLNKQFDAALEQALAPFREQLAGKPSEPAQGSEKSPAVSPELIAMSKKMELMEKSMNAREQQILAKERATRERDAFGTVSSKLKDLGVRAEGVEHLAKVLKHDGKIKIDDEGSISFVDGDDEMDLDIGLKAYLNPKTNPSIALYLPPKTATVKGKSNNHVSADARSYKPASGEADKPSFSDALARARALINKS